MEHSYTGELPQASPAWPRAVAGPKAERNRAATGPRARTAARRFDLLRWFSIASLVALVPVAAATGALLSHFVAEQALHRDAILTAEFVRNCVLVESGAFGANGLHGNAIDFNLKFNTYTGNLTIENFDLQNTGSSGGQKIASIVRAILFQARSAKPNGSGIAWRQTASLRTATGTRQVLRQPAGKNAMSPGPSRHS